MVDIYTLRLHLFHEKWLVWKIFAENDHLYCLQKGTNEKYFHRPRKCLDTNCCRQWEHFLLTNYFKQNKLLVKMFSKSFIFRKTNVVEIYHLSFDPPVVKTLSGATFFTADLAVKKVCLQLLWTVCQILYCCSALKIAAVITVSRKLPCPFLRCCSCKGYIPNIEVTVLHSTTTTCATMQTQAHSFTRQILSSTIDVI